MVGIRNRLSRLHRWQTLVAAVVALLGAVIVALIGNASDHTSANAGRSTAPPPVEGPPSNSTDSVHQLSLSFTSWTETTVHPPAKEFDFVGQVTGLPMRWDVYVVAKIASPAQAAQQRGGSASRSPGSWMVSPKATRAQDGRWHVRWRIDNPPSKVTWVAVVFDDTPAPGTDSGNAPIESAPPTDTSRPTPSSPASRPTTPLDNLRHWGPTALGVRATASPQNSHS
ncbi:hypothetical protein GCM10010278_75060 [Streptomyces melanogenes]|nr:hypothetical protein GCM10010278_75060 [Streptomyces melanogenes]